MTKQYLAAWLGLIAAGCATAVIILNASGLGVAALYVTVFGATVLLCGLEYLRRAAGHG